MPLGRSQNGYIRNACNLKVEGLNIEQMIKERMNVETITRNDGICAGIAEKEYGALKGFKNGVFLGFGTGVGTAVFINGKLEENVRSAGHIIIQKDGKECNCGRKGCYETYASMKVLKHEIRERFGNMDLSSKEILELLQQTKNLEKLEDIIQNYIEYVSIGVANFARICSADMVAMGGSFVYFKDILFNKLQKELDRIIPKNERENLQIKLATLGNDAGIIGATIK